MSARSPANRPAQPPRGFIFDLDGTLCDSAGAITASINVALAEMGRPLTDQRTVARLLGMPLADKFTELLGEPDGEQMARFVATFRDHYRRTCADATRLLPGVLDTLQYLVSMPVPLGIATTKPREFAELILSHLGCLGLFTAIIGIEDVANAKPDPEPIEKAVAALGLDAAECVYVGDTPTDVGGAHAAGVKCIGVYSGAYTRDELDTAGADWLLAGVSDIPAWLAGTTYR